VADNTQLRALPWLKGAKSDFIFFNTSDECASTNRFRIFKHFPVKLEPICFFSLPVQASESGSLA
jgi:hypothetical protein